MTLVFFPVDVLVVRCGSKMNISTKILKTVSANFPSGSYCSFVMAVMVIRASNSACRPAISVGQMEPILPECVVVSSLSLLGPF